MKLQVAIDRISLDKAVDIAKQLNGIVDIIEIGTSLVKDYGNKSIRDISEVVNRSKVLVDTKTIDEGNYEFNQAFKNGADVVTVMGASSYETLKACYKVANEYGKEMMIDLLNLKDTQITQIENFSKAIYLIHHSKDKKYSLDVVEEINNFKKMHKSVNNIAVAGGIDRKTVLDVCNQTPISIVVVGSKILKNNNPLLETKKFMEVLK